MRRSLRRDRFGRGGLSRFDAGDATVAIIGGIWDMPARYQERMTFAPERLLADELEGAGLDIHRFGHLSNFRPSDFDIIHVHCAAWGVLRVLEDRSDTRFVYTNHVSQPPSLRSAVLTRAAMRTTDHFVALSDTERVRVSERYRVPPERSSVIPNGIDSSVFHFSQPAPPSSAPWRLLFVGQLVHFKAPGLLLDAMDLLRQQHDLRLELVYQSAVLEEDLRQKAADLGLSERIRFTGLLRPEEVAARMRAAHLLVLPSLGIEELPAVVTQAMMCGRQVVATDVGSISEQLGTNGIITTPGSGVQLAEGIARALATYPEFCLEAKRVSQAAMVRFSLPAMVSAHLETYRHSLTGARPVRLTYRGQRTVRATRLAGWFYRPFANHPPQRD